MDVHPPKNGIFIGIDPYPYWYWQPSGKHGMLAHPPFSSMMSSFYLHVVIVKTPIFLWLSGLAFPLKPPVHQQFAIENDPVIVDIPTKNGEFPVRCVVLPEAKTPGSARFKKCRQASMIDDDCGSSMMPNFSWNARRNGEAMGNSSDNYRMVPPSDVSWFINPINYSTYSYIMLYHVISTINHSEMGVMFTNLANELGHHLVWNLR